MDAGPLYLTSSTVFVAGDERRSEAGKWKPPAALNHSHLLPNWGQSFHKVCFVGDANTLWHLTSPSAPQPALCWWSVMDVYNGREIVCPDQLLGCQREIATGETSVSRDKKKPCREKWLTEKWKVDREKGKEKNRTRRLMRDGGGSETSEGWNKKKRSSRRKRKLYLWSRNLICRDSVAWGRAECIES